jgi:hypothetical protein
MKHLARQAASGGVGGSARFFIRGCAGTSSEHRHLAERASQRALLHSLAIFGKSPECISNLRRNGFRENAIGVKKSDKRFIKRPHTRSTKPFVSKAR